MYGRRYKEEEDRNNFDYHTDTWYNLLDIDVTHGDICKIIILIGPEQRILMIERYGYIIMIMSYDSGHRA